MMPPSTTRILLSLIGLALAVASLVVMFQGQALWGWLLILLAFGAGWLGRRLG